MAKKQEVKVRLNRGSALVPTEMEVFVYGGIRYGIKRGTVPDDNGHRQWRITHLITGMKVLEAGTRNEAMGQLAQVHERVAALVQRMYDELDKLVESPANEPAAFEYDALVRGTYGKDEA